MITLTSRLALRYKLTKLGIQINDGFHKEIEKDVYRSGKGSVTIEEQGLAAVRERIGNEFVLAVEAVLSCPGRLVITGIGKSGIIGQKISATLNSTGTPSFFLHPVEAMHGDLGMVMAGDVILAISYSGETAELNALLISLKERGNRIIAMTGGCASSLARAADIVLDIRVPKEACPLGLAPTASTTATLAMGDALSVVLLNRKKFQAEDFRLNHPGGSLGQRLKVKVTEVMIAGEDIPLLFLPKILRQMLFGFSMRRIMEQFWLLTRITRYWVLSLMVMFDVQLQS